jgi:hypothetical protein
MSKGRVGEDRGSKEMDGCPLTHMYTLGSLQNSKKLANTKWSLNRHQKM